VYKAQVPYDVGDLQIAVPTVVHGGAEEPAQGDKSIPTTEEKAESPIFLMRILMVKIPAVGNV
jgi:hypothetical protein